MIAIADIGTKATAQESDPLAFRIHRWATISRRVLHSSWNLGFVTIWDRIFTLFPVQALNCCTIGENLNRSVGMCLNDPNLTSETTSAALFPVLIPLLQLCLDSAWQNSLIKSERFVQQARHTLTLDEDLSSGAGKEVTLRVEPAKGS